MCKKCGCNTCELEIRGPLLTEGRVKKLVSKYLQYHIDKNIPLMENVFRMGSDAHLSIIKEARKLYSRNVLDLCKSDEALMKTHIGEFALYENQIVPLDLPILNEININNIAGSLLFSRKNENQMNAIKPIVDKLYGSAEKAGQELLSLVKREGKQTLYAFKEIAEWVIKNEKPNKSEMKKIVEQLKDFGYLAALGLSEFKLFALLFYIIDKSNIADKFLKLDEINIGAIEESLAIYNDGKGNYAEISKDPEFGYIATISGEYDYQLSDANYDDLIAKLVHGEGFTQKIQEAYYAYVMEGNEVKKVSFNF